jgi:hypothetical protein
MIQAAQVSVQRRSGSRWRSLPVRSRGYGQPGLDACRVIVGTNSIILDCFSGISARDEAETARNVLTTGKPYTFYDRYALPTPGLGCVGAGEVGHHANESQARFALVSDKPWDALIRLLVCELGDADMVLITIQVQHAEVELDYDAGDSVSFSDTCLDLLVRSWDWAALREHGHRMSEMHVVGIVQCGFMAKSM